jgi:glucose/arabinose dehydrogenase
MNTRSLGSFAGRWVDARRFAPRRFAARRLAVAYAVAVVVTVAAGGVAATNAVFAQGACAAAPAANTSLVSVPVAIGLNGRPLFVASPPGDRSRLFIVTQDGTILIHKRGDPLDVVTTFLDISAIVQHSTNNNEMGLLGLAFDPDYAQNGLFYVNYTEGPVFGPWFTVVARYSVAAGDPDTADPTSEARVLRFSQPENNHNGGQLQFGPDGYLYISTGDGGGGGDIHGTCGNGQNTATLLGKILRIDVRGIAPSSVAPDCGGATTAYRIPSANPLANGLGGACDEIWAYGVRNPWRSAFDPVNGDFYVADVGQNCWEEIDYLPAAGNGGQNFGWRSMEATHCFNPSAQSNCNPAPVACAGTPTCNDPSLKLPVLEYSHASGGCSITGGYVYRGCLMPNYQGTYFYGDFCAAFIRTFRMAGGVVTNPADVTVQIDPGHTLANSLTSFGVDSEGEIYITNRGGTILRLLPPLPDLEVSGPGSATPFLLGSGGWTWEDLGFDTMSPVASYHVYRGAPGGSYRCVFQTTAHAWVPGDPVNPPVGTVFAYVVVAVGPSGEVGKSASPPVTLTVDPCP